MSKTPVILAALGLALSACATPAASAVSLKVTTRPGVSVRLASVHSSEDRVRFQGVVCRAFASDPAPMLRFNLVGADGQLVARATRQAPGARRGAPCAFYDLSIPWAVTSDQRVEICAARLGGTCNDA